MNMILDFFKKYIFGFFAWWYLVKGREVVDYFSRTILKYFVRLNIGPMLGNLFAPMFQDKSLTGRFIAFPIRLIWGLGGLIIELIIIAIGLVFLHIYFLLPIAVIYQIVTFVVLK